MVEFDLVLLSTEDATAVRKWLIDFLITVGDLGTTKIVRTSRPNWFYLYS